MPSWYASREQIKSALEIAGSNRNALIDAHIEGASREIDRLLGRRFIPKTQIRRFNWPQDKWTNMPGQVLYVDEDLLSVSLLTSSNGAKTIPGTEYNLEPVNEGPPYSRIEIKTNTADANAVFEANTTKQQAIAVTGSWGYGNDREAAGTVSSGLATDAAATTFACSDASLIDVGDTLLIESEQLFVSERASVDSTANLTVSLTAAKDNVTVTVDTGSLVKQGEVILIESERMYVQSISGNNLTVIRAYDGSVLAAHTQPIDVYVFRTLTVTRGINGTTAATHANAIAVSKYAPPLDIQTWCRAEAIFNYEQDQSGHTGVVGGADGGVNIRSDLRNAMKGWAMTKYLRRLAMVL